jgi:hypothetical protein
MLGLLLMYWKLERQYSLPEWMSWARGPVSPPQCWGMT